MGKSFKRKSLRSSTIMIFTLLFLMMAFSVYILINTVMMKSIDQLEEKM